MTKHAFRKITAAMLLGGAALAAHAETFPSHPITLIVPYPPGGTTDIAARVIAHAMSVDLKQSIVIENRPGASGNIGIGTLKRADPDGYTIAITTSGIQTINQFIFKDMPFDPAKDFTALAMVFTTPNVIAVRNESPLKSMQDLLTRAKDTKEKPLSYATPGVGSSVHLTGAYLEHVLGANLLHVPFKGVSGSMPALIGGQVDILMDNLPSTLPQLQDGSKIRALAVTSGKRVPSLPNVPTVAESGLKDFDVEAWFALYAPAGIPADVRATLIKSAEKALATPEIQKKFTELGATPGKLSGDKLKAFEDQERERWGKMVKEGNITASQQ